MPNANQGRVDRAVQNAAGISPGIKNDVVPCCEPQVHLQIGIFFDGTGNNAPFDKVQQDILKEWKDKNEDVINTFKNDRDNNYNSATKAASNTVETSREGIADIDAAENNVQQLRAEQAELERQAQWHYNCAMSCGQAKEGLGELGHNAEAMYQLQGKALDAWREAKSKANRKAVEAERAEAELERAKKECYRQRDAHSKKAQNFPASPDESSPSNIVKLHDIYEKDAGRKIYSIYIQGIGTVSNAKNQADYSNLGMGFGLGPEGGEARILEAKAAVRDILQEYKTCSPHVIIDIFGFSRGAALARHFVNVLLDGLPDFTKKPEESYTAPPILGAVRYEAQNDEHGGDDGVKYVVHPPLPKKHVTIRFVGLFDTVGSFYWPGNANEVKFNLHLPAGCANKVVHLVARDERRVNFRYTSIGGVGEEIILPGVHSDIGGGYPLMEKIFLVIDKARYLQTLFGGSEREAEDMLLRRAAGSKAVQNGTVAFGYFFMHVPELQDRNGPQLMICYLMRAKVTDNDYANVALNLMYNKAIAAQVPFENPIGASGKHAFAIPSDILVNAEYIPTMVTPALEGKYLHVSAVDVRPQNPDKLPALGRYHPCPLTQFAMRLDDNPAGPRVFFPN